MPSNTARAIAPYPFSPDFTAPDSDAQSSGDTLRMTAGELVYLLDQARQEGMALAARARDDSVAASAETVLARLGAAMDDIQGLMQQVEEISRRSREPGVHAAVARVAQSVLDGQGDLFVRTHDTTETTP